MTVRPAKDEQKTVGKDTVVDDQSGSTLKRLLSRWRGKQQKRARRLPGIPISLFVNHEEVAALFQDCEGHIKTLGEQKQQRHTRQRISSRRSKQEMKVERRSRPGTISPRQPQNPRIQRTRGELRRRP